MKFKLAGNTLVDLFVTILALPLISFYFLQHVIEEVLIKSRKFKDKIFMKRFNLIDQKHVSDLIEWNKEYRRKRERNKEY